jgi:hypothetical protein
MFWFAVLLVVASYVGIGALRASMLDVDETLDAFREGFREARGEYPSPDLSQLYVRQIKKAYIVLWAVDDLGRLLKALRG